MIAKRYDLYSETLELDEAEQVMEDAISEDAGLRNKGVHNDFRHFIEPNGSGFDLVQVIDSYSGYTPVYFHIGEEVRKEGNMEWEEVEELLSYDPRKAFNRSERYSFSA